MTTHLSKAAIAIVENSAEERIRYIKNDRWIGYTRAKNILDNMEDLLSHPKKSRMPNMLLVGESDNGKTMLLERFVARHPARDNAKGDAIVVPVFMIQAPPVPDENRFYSMILERLFAPYRPSDRIEKKQQQAIRILKQVDLGVIIIDEIQHVLAGHLSKQRQFLNVIKFLGNELKVPIIAAGVKDAYRAIQTDKQLASRFEPVILPKWEIGEEYLRLLMSFERMLPLKKPSNLIERDIALKILGMSDGTIGSISKLLTKAAIYAVKNGTERITLTVLKKIEWTTLNDRKRMLDRVS